MDAACGAADRGRIEARQPIGQSDQRHQVELSDEALVLAERGDDHGRILPAEARPEHRPADDLGGQRRHLAQRIDRRPGRQHGPALGGLVRGLDHGRREQSHARGMHDRRDDAAPFLPGLAVADKEAVAEQWKQRVTHLRRLALEAVVQADEGLRHGVRAVADEQHAVEHAHAKKLVLEALLVEHGEEVAPRRAQDRQRSQGLAGTRRIGRHEMAHRSAAAVARNRTASLRADASRGKR